MKCNLNELLKNTELYNELYTKSFVYKIFNISKRIKHKLGIHCKHCSCIKLFKNKDELNKFIGNHPNIRKPSLEFNIYLNMVFYLKQNNYLTLPESVLFSNLSKLINDSKLLQKLTYVYGIEFGVHYIYSDSMDKLYTRELVRGAQHGVGYNTNIINNSKDYWGSNHSHPKGNSVHGFSDIDIDYYTYRKKFGFVIDGHIFGVVIPDGQIAYLDIKSYSIVDDDLGKGMDFYNLSKYPPGNNWLFSKNIRNNNSLQLFSWDKKKEISFEEVYGNQGFINIQINNPEQAIEDIEEEYEYLIGRIEEARRDDSKLGQLLLDDIENKLRLIEDIYASAIEEYLKNEGKWGNRKAITRTHISQLIKEYRINKLKKSIELDIEEVFKKWNDLGFINKEVLQIAIESSSKSMDNKRPYKEFTVPESITLAPLISESKVRLLDE